MNSVVLSVVQTAVCVFILVSVIILLVRTGRKNEAKPKGRLNVLDISGVPEAEGCKRVALLIDADNVSSRYAGKIMENIGYVCDSVLVYMCLYGVHEKQADWMSVSQEYGIEQKFQKNYLKGKNSTDFRIVIDCMDLLHTEDIDIFVLCSSDSDFSGIAERLAEDGKVVVGMGNDSTPEVFRKKCSKFFLIDDKETSVEELERVLRQLIAHYNDKAPCHKIKPLITQRFGLCSMGFRSFELMLNAFGYCIDNDDFIVKNDFATCMEEIHA